MAVEIEKLRAEIRNDISLIAWVMTVALFAALAAGAAILGLVLHLAGKL